MKGDGMEGEGGVTGKKREKRGREKKEKRGKEKGGDKSPL